MTKMVLLGDICDVRDGTHDSPKPSSSGFPLVTSKHIKNGRVDLTSTYKVSESDYEAINRRSKVDRYDILLGMIGTVGEVALVDEEPNFAIKNVGLIKARDKRLGKYLYYYFLSPLAKSKLKSLLSGSTQKFIGLNQLRNFPIILPENVVQEKVASILESLDQKIELNRRMNETLEKIGQALFKHHFIDNPERKSWETRKLGEFVEVVNGASYKSSELSTSDTALITLGNFVRGGGFKRDGYKEFTGKLKDSQIIHDGDILVAHTDVTQKAEIAGVPALATGTKKYRTVGISMDVARINSVDENISSGFLYFLLMSPEFQNHKAGYVSGTTVLHLNKKCIPSFSLEVPRDTNQIGNLSALFQPIVEKIAANEDEVETLASLRDSLLPRLISGGLKV